MNREAFLNQINQEGFSFSIDITRWGFSDFKSVVRRRRISEEELYQMFWSIAKSWNVLFKRQGIIVV